MAVRILALALLAALAGGCAREEPTHLTVTFLVTGEETRYQLEVDCNSAEGSTSDPQRICAGIEDLREVLFPRNVVACSLPVPTLYANLVGTHLGEEVHLVVSPCTDVEERALAEWAALLGFQHPLL